MHDLIIVGGGPAGAAAAVYAARKRLKTILITNEWGGQSNVSADIENWIGTPHISGADLAKNLKAHVDAHVGESLSTASGKVASLESSASSVSVTLSNGTKYEARTLLVATGSERRKLEVPGAAQYDQKGLTYCATCDGPLFDGQDVVVVGAGNAAFESALQLLAYCKTVTLLNRTETFRADEVTVEAARSNPKMRILNNTIPTEVIGEQFVKGMKIKNVQTDEESTLDVTGIFIEIGLIPNTDWLGTTVPLNATKQVIVDPMTQRTNNARIWAAGDCTSGLYHQNNIAAGDAVKALEDIYLFVRKDK